MARIISVATGEAAVKRFADESVDLVFLDIRMPGMDGIEVLKRIKAIDVSVPVVMVTAVNDVQKASACVRAGAFNYIVKPFDIEQILEMARQLIARRRRQSLMNEIEPQAPRLWSGQTKPARDLREKLSQAAAEDRPILFVGEEGVEVEEAAHYVHRSGARAAAPFQAYFVSPHVRSRTVMDALFGRGLGDFTSTVERGLGLIEECRGGTLLLVHPENIPADVQEALARAFEEGMFTREGTLQRIKVDVRLMASTTVDVKDLIELKPACGRFFALFANPWIAIPPLRQRAGDLVALINQIIEETLASRRSPVQGFTATALEALSEYTWPGNMAELHSLIERLVISGDRDLIPMEQLPLDILIQTLGEASPDAKRPLAFESLSNRFDKEHVYRVMKSLNFDKSSAAARLGLSDSAFLSKIEE